MKRKSLVLVLLITFIFIVGIAYWQFLTFGLEVQKTAATATKMPLGQGVENLKEIESKQIHVINDNNFSSVTEESKFNDQDKRDIEQWHTGGITDPAYKESDYSLYDETTLLAMANSGNTMAMKALWFRYLKEDQLEYVQKRNELATKAIIYGDREMFMHMPELISAQSRLSDQSISPEERRLAEIETLAYSEFMGLRGSLGEKYSQQKVFFHVYSKPNAPIRLSEADKVAIRLRAKEIYDNFEQKRIELGIGPFDNSVPEGMKKFFEIQEKIYLKEVGDNAI